MAAASNSFAGAASGFDNLKSLSFEEAEDCMFGAESDEDSVPSSSNGPQRLPYFTAIADWPVKQAPQMQVSSPSHSVHDMLQLNLIVEAKFVQQQTFL